jgi:hypothetical protein
MAVAVQIGNCDSRESNAINATRVVTDRCLEGAVAVAQQNADPTIVAAVALGRIGYDQIWITVAGHVTDRNGEGRSARAVTNRCLEATIAVAAAALVLAP